MKHYILSNQSSLSKCRLEYKTAPPFVMLCKVKDIILSVQYAVYSWVVFCVSYFVFRV